MFYGFRFNGSIKALGHRTFLISPRVLSDATVAVRAEKMTPEEGAYVFVATAQNEGRLSSSPQLEYLQKRQLEAWEAEGKLRTDLVTQMVKKYEWRSFPF